MRREFKPSHKIFRVLAEPLRADIVLSMRRGEKTVNEICDYVYADPATVSGALAVIRKSGLVVSNRVGKHVYNRLTGAGFYMVGVIEEVERRANAADFLREHGLG